MNIESHGSKQAAWMMLTALEDGRPDDVRVTLASLDRFIPAGSEAGEAERRELLEELGHEVIAQWGGALTEAGMACRNLLEHLAGTAKAPISRYLQ